MKIESTADSSITLTLHLSRLEAIILRSIMRNISGRSNGPRDMTDDIADHLGEQGVPHILLSDGSTGSIALPDSWDDKALAATQGPLFTPDF